MSTYFKDWVPALSAATIAGTETLPVVQSGVSKKTTPDALATWAITALASGAAVSPAAAGDDIVLLRSNVQKLCDIDVMATYIVASAWTAAEADPAVTGDMLVIDRSGTKKTLDVDTMAAYALASGASAAAVTPVAALDKFVLYRSDVIKRADVSDLSTYVLAQTWSADAVTTLLSTDELLIGRSAASKNITLANLETQLTTDLKTGFLNISGLSTATLGATDELLVNQAGVGLKVALSALETKLDTDFATYVGALTDAATVVDADKFYLLNSGTPKYCTATEIATYVTAELWAGSAVNPAVAGDIFLINRSGTTGDMDIDVLATYIQTAIQTNLLDLSGLSAATVASSDLLLVCQGTTAKKGTVAVVGEVVLDLLPAHLTALDAAAALQPADLLYITQGGTAKKVDLDTVAAYAAEVALDLPWRTIAGAKYTATPASTSTLTMSDTSDLAVGLPVKYVYGGVTYYGIVTALSANALMTIAGATFDTGQALTALYVGVPEMVVQLDLFIEQIWDDAVQDILAEVGEQYFKWQRGAACLVAFSVAQHWPDSGATEPYVNVKINGSLVSTDASNKGVQCSAVAGTWVESSAVTISTSNYDIARGEAVELRCTQQGTTGDAEGLTVSLVFVLE